PRPLPCSPELPRVAPAPWPLVPCEPLQVSETPRLCAPCTFEPCRPRRTARFAADSTLPLGDKPRMRPRRTPPALQKSSRSLSIPLAFCEPFFNAIWRGEVMRIFLPDVAGGREETLRPSSPIYRPASLSL